MKINVHAQISCFLSTVYLNCWCCCGWVQENICGDAHSGCIFFPIVYFCVLNQNLFVFCMAIWFYHCHLLFDWPKIFIRRLYFRPLVYISVAPLSVHIASCGNLLFALFQHWFFLTKSFAETIDFQTFYFNCSCSISISTCKIEIFSYILSTEIF